MQGAGLLRQDGAMQQSCSRVRICGMRPRPCPAESHLSHLIPLNPTYPGESRQKYRVIYLTETADPIFYAIDVMRLAPGKSHREGITICSSRNVPGRCGGSAWFESLVWPTVGTAPGVVAPRPAMRLKLRACPTTARPASGHVSVTDRHCLGSKVSMRQWVFAIYLDMTSLKRRVLNEAASGHRRPENSVVRAAPYPRGLVCGTRRPILRPW